MLRSFNDETDVVTIAKWDSKENWEAFWKNENPSEMLEMRKIGKRISVTVYDEIDDLTY